jgi:hypothetical protein
MRVLSLVSVLVVTGCSGPGDDESSIVGRWRELPNAFADGQDPTALDLWTFRDDGTFETASGGSVEPGTYAIDGDVLILQRPDSQDRPPFEITFVVRGDHFVWGALKPVGAVDGAVGTWQGYVAFEGIHTTVTQVLRADGTGTIAYDRDVVRDEEFDGTWEESGTSFRFTYTLDDVTTVRLLGHRLDEAAIGPMYERIDG